ncbi:F-box/LRR-repeat protein 12-like [Lytechinus pictus]|uniref:F-box/LRR-repeat protein 12-like n=1 Tax=Lytechinus pictus TaxID=7653 RepID=UPI0030BA03FF
MPRSKDKEDALMNKALRTTKTPCNSAANSLDVNAVLDLGDVCVDSDVLTPQKVADHLSSAIDSEMGECPVRSMPDSVMLQILGYLSVKDLCRAACVCRGWNHLVRQKPLWRVVDLSPYKISLVNIRKLVFAYFSDSLRSLSLGGFLSSVKNTECISDSLLQELGNRCPKLQELCIRGADLLKASSTNLPPKLQTLKLISCNYPTFWLTAAFKQSKLDSLQHLDMTCSNGFGNRDLESITPAPMTSVLVLKLRNCYRITPRGTSRITDNFPNLKELDLSKLPQNNETLQKIGRNLTQLRILRLHQCTNSENVLFDLHHLSPLKQLEELDVSTMPDNSPFSESPTYDGNVLAGLANSLPKLKVLLVSKNKHFTEGHVQRVNNGCVMHQEEGDARAMWMIGFYPHDRLITAAQQQTH